MHSKFLFLILITITLCRCGLFQNAKKKLFEIKISGKQSKFIRSQTLIASLQALSESKMDSVTYLFANQNKTTNTSGLFEQKLDAIKLGKQQIKAVVYHAGGTDTVTKTITILHHKTPKIYKYEIVATYPHDPKSYTQGLEFVGDTLYESTGKKGASVLRKIEYQSGKVLQEIKLDKQYFGEGITILRNKIYQLTWMAKVGFIYRLDNLEKIGTFGFNKSKQGWGLCNDGNVLYKSDGTEKIWKLHPETLAEQDFIQITTNKSIKSRFNELEWIEGKIYANTYQKDGIAIINPKDGALEAVINLKGLRRKATPPDKQDSTDYVLNGIAFNKNTNQLFVTGKYWDKIFEIRVIKHLSKKNAKI